MTRLPHSFFAQSPHIMGIVNVTPDSFSDGGRHNCLDAAIAHGLKLIKDGADSLDIGGESTRPGATPVSPEEEQARIIPVIEGLKGTGAIVSVDTRHAATMEAALKAGASVINDVSGLTYDRKSVSVVSDANVPVIIMHMQGDPTNMQGNPFYNSMMYDLLSFFKERLEYCRQNRIEKSMVVFDPGIGFGKSDEHNLLILRYIKEFQVLDVPLMLGTSRKSFIARLSNAEPADQRIGGSLASIIWGLEQGVQFFRVHDVSETRQAFTIYEAIKAAKSKTS